MPVLKKIVVQDWRNIELQDLDFCPNINCISGDNGEGKTNLLDAIYCMSMTKSAFSASDRYNYRHGTNSYAIAGAYELESGLPVKFSLKSSSNGEKKVLRDGKPYQRISEHIGTVPIVMVSPSDSSLVSESSDERRRFANAVLSQMDRTFLSDIQHYNKILDSRNALLKSEDPDLGVLETLDPMLSMWGARIHSKRKAFTSDIEPLVQEFYEKLSGGHETVSIRYRSDLDKAPLEDLLKDSREKDRFLKFTSVGIQRDDLIFGMDGEPIRRVGSQGQQKSFLVSLKFAQYEIMKRNYGFPPILLLDDLFDKLDMGRTENLLKMVAGKDFGQIFLSDTNKVRLRNIICDITEESTYYEARGGVFTKL